LRCDAPRPVETEAMTREEADNPTVPVSAGERKRNR
jgi:hypothetical protein